MIARPDEPTVLDSRYCIPSKIGRGGMRAHSVKSMPSGSMKCLSGPPFFLFLRPSGRPAARQVVFPYRGLENTTWASLARPWARISAAQASDAILDGKKDGNNISFAIATGAVDVPRFNFAGISSIQTARLGRISCCGCRLAIPLASVRAH